MTHFNNAASPTDQLSCGMQKSLSAKQRMDLLREELLARRRPTDQHLVEKLGRCGNDWKDGRYPCRSPACPRCRRRNWTKQARETVELLGHFSNEELAFVTVVLPGTLDITGIEPLIAKSRRDTANRFKAARRIDEQWHGTYLRGWHEIDALAPDHFAILPPERLTLIPNLAPVALDGISPTWVPSWHSIMFTNGLALDDVADQFRRQWKLDQQVDVSAFDPDKTVRDNLVNLTSYANKFHCTTSLYGGIKEAWPVSWQAEFFGYLNRRDRSPFETLRMTINQFDPMVRDDVKFSSPMPTLSSFTRVPMFYNNGRM